MIIVKLHEILRTKVECGITCTMKNRRSSGVVVPLKGCMDFVFCDTVIRCDKNHGIFLPEGFDYQIVGIETTENLLFNFKTDIPPTSPVIINITDSKMFEQIFDEAERAITSKNQHKAFALYYQMLEEAFDKKSVKKPSERYVDEAELIILKELENNLLSCSYIASAINVSEVYLRKLFIKYRGVPMSIYIQALRMKKARAYLSEGYSVGEAGRSVGYTDIYQFSRAYKKYYGHSPTKE